VIETRRPFAETPGHGEDGPNQVLCPCAQLHRCVCHCRGQAHAPPHPMHGAKLSGAYGPSRSTVLGEQNRSYIAVTREPCGGVKRENQVGGRRQRKARYTTCPNGRLMSTILNQWVSFRYPGLTDGIILSTWGGHRTHMTTYAEIHDLAQQTVETVQKVSELATHELEISGRNPANAFGQLNTFTDTRVLTH